MAKAVGLTWYYQRYEWRSNMKRKISAKILVLAGALFAADISDS